jgi:transcription antitermination factor NusG
VHRWSDRNKTIDVPLFPCYAFVHAAMIHEVQGIALRQPGVLRWIAFQGRPSPIPQEEIFSIQKVLNSGMPVGPRAFLRIGERVRIRGGALDGVAGILTGNDDKRQLVVSVDLLGQSVAVSLHNYQLEVAA